MLVMYSLNSLRPDCRSILVAIACWLILSGPAAGPAMAEVTEAVAIGDRECASCHRIEARAWQDSRHGKVFTLNPRTEREAMGCEGCHGPGSRHLDVVGEMDHQGPLHIRAFGKPEDAAQTNALCLNCHQGGAHLHWQGSTHAIEGLACTDCHTIHMTGERSPMAACIGCHTSQRAMLQRSSHMPMREGRVTCMDCHNPHGGSGPAALRTATVNETCYRCHAEKRGPHLFEHPPVMEDCTWCHDPHGSNHPSLLKRQAPWLCQQCHASAGHAGRLFQGQDLANRGVPQLRGQSCMNCHSRIHGSSHPSGARFQR